MRPRAHEVVGLVSAIVCAGKNYCADFWASVLSISTSEDVLARAVGIISIVSISDATKREYTAATANDLHRLREERSFKEQHRRVLTAFYLEQVRQRPILPQEHFLDVVHSAVAFDVLLVAGMRSEAPIATLSRLVPESEFIAYHIAYEG